MTDVHYFSSDKPEVKGHLATLLFDSTPWFTTNPQKVTCPTCLLDMAFF